jgi:hypothetical protein
MQTPRSSNLKPTAVKPAVKSGALATKHRAAPRTMSLFTVGALLLSGCGGMGSTDETSSTQPSVATSTTKSSLSGPQDIPSSGDPVPPRPSIDSAQVSVPPPLESEIASAFPNRARTGDRVTITLASALVRNCLDVVDVFDFDYVYFGRILGDGTWQAASAGLTPPTTYTCVERTTIDPVETVIPPLSPGGYLFCVSPTVDYRGCATVFTGES